ncbi:hypothetical protein E6P97_03190 [Patescibacteria group bacterium]|nr:MAG: hypothetical protein E6P97_03190 [Patescibacteria group bacterium]
MSSAAGAVAGLTLLTREETLIFMLPLLAGFLWFSKATLKHWFVASAVMGLCFLPQVVVKYQVMGTVTSSGHDSSYTQTLDKYLVPSQLYRNTWETLIDSKHFGEPQASRPALLQAAPWLWIAPLGVVVILASRRYPMPLKWFVLVSVGLMVFYLSGSNMSAQKLQFHCLRYISAGLIMLNLAVVVVCKEGYDKITGRKKRTHNA